VKDISAFLEFDLFRKIIDELSPFPETILTLHRRGESLLHPRFSDCLEYIKGKFKTIQLATNATLLNDEISHQLIDTLSFISFSLDLPHAYSQKRPPARYNTVEKKVSRFLEMNAGCLETQVSMVRTMDTSDRDVDQFKAIWKSAVDRVRIYEEHSSDGSFGSLRRRRNRRVPCTMPFYEIQVLSNGTVGRCNHDWEGPPLGNLNTESIRDVWNSPLYQALRRDHAALTFSDVVCRSCDSWYPVEGKQMTGEFVENNI
jgi:radical SAM protein with 4Fe4S-binding SPASM domain